MHTTPSTTHAAQRTWKTLSAVAQNPSDLVEALNTVVRWHGADGLAAIWEKLPADVRNEVQALCDRADGYWFELRKALPALALPRPTHTTAHLVTVYVPSDTHEGASYQVDFWSDNGQARCSCPGFSFRHHCKHLDRALAAAGWNRA